MSIEEILESLKKLEHEAEKNCEYPEMNIALLELQDCIAGIKIRLSASNINYPETGRVLWWSDKDKNGVIVDRAGNEFYTDISVLKNAPRQGLDKDQLINFTAARLNDGTRVARDISCL